jgi:hypothetical protein
MSPIELTCTGLVGDIQALACPAPLPGAAAYEASDTAGTEIVYRIELGELAGPRWLTFDLLLESDTTAAFQLRFYEPEETANAGKTEGTGEAAGAGRAEPFAVQFMPMIWAQARIRVPMTFLDMNRWDLPREGAWLKALCTGWRVDPARVDRIALAVIRTGGRRVRFSMTPPRLTDAEPPLLRDPLLPKGILLDRFGQCAVRDWPAKTRSQAELVDRLRGQLRESAGAAFPEGFSKWGGSAKERFRATGFFRVEKTDRGWEMVDPDGCAWWSAGLDCVRSDIDSAVGGLETALEEPLLGAAYEGFVASRYGQTLVNYLGANLRRAFRDTWHEDWAAIALAQLRRLGFNTVANWSEWQIARDTQFPYVRPMDWQHRPTPRIYRDFPDVFDPVFEQEATAFAKQLEVTKNDPAFVGYFLMNEPTWGFSSECPAAGMLFTHERSHTRKRLAQFLQGLYGTSTNLATAWGMTDASLEAAESGVWKTPLTGAAVADLERFSTLMADRLFTTLSQACRAIDPNHLNLGIRYAGFVPEWALAGMKSFDVFSINMYRETVADDLGETICRVVDRPLLIGEWHFGALDAGLPSTGIGHVATQADRGRAYRVYLEDAAAKPWCVGVHYFTMYDESAIGRYDGENYNIGFFDVCNRPYEPLAAAAQASHTRMYAVRAGETQPYSDRPEYLPKVFS